ncbi:MAG: hypothetical protein KME17_02215 [Cyanosarcina radialis HA8281-LM2]|jgi:hypothetical protein|nr:hypothetical protein [Cyanosarcina radialis HA8281-LM2]
MSNLTATLQGILDWLTVNAPDRAGSLSTSGLSRQQIDELLNKSELNINITEDVYELYQWRNGALGQGFSFLQFLIFYPLEESIIESTRIEEIFIDPEPDRFPADIGLILFSYDSYFFFTVSCQHNRSYSELWVYDIKSYWYPFLCYKSLSSFFSTILECYTTQAYYLNEYRSWKADRKKIYNTFRKHNPTIMGLQLNTTPIIWLLIREINPVAGILYLGKSLNDQLESFLILW